MNTLKLALITAFLFVHYISNAQTYTTPGTYTWVVPPCVTTITVKVWGGGGGGGGTSSRQSNTGDEACTEGGGGGGGGFSMRTYAVTPGETYTIVVGAGGTGGVGANNTAVAGATGGTSTFTGPATVPFGSLTGFGGIGGGGATANNNNSGSHIGSNGAGGAGGTGANGTTIFTGGNGSAGSHSAGCSDISGAGTTGNGSNGQYIGACPHTTAMAGGAGAASNGGNGANGIKNNIASKHNQNGNNGSAYGGGGGGAGIHLNSWANQWVLANGGAGAAGAVLIEYSASGAPVDPTVGITAANCSAAGSATVSNYNASYTYTFSPAGPTIGAGGTISGATPGTAYTVIGNNGACNSNAVAFTVPTQLPTPANPIMSSNPASCSSAGTSTVTNYSAGNTYVFSPSGPTIGAGGTIAGATPGTTYTITAGNGGCTSTPASFTNAAQLPTTATPTINTVAATCSTAGSSTITNYNTSFTYAFSPAGPTIGAGGTISGATPGSTYTITATSGGCTSLSTSFTNAVQLSTTPTPSITSTAATCSSAGSSTIANYNASYTYAFSPAGPTAGVGGTINGAIPGTIYTITASSGGCISLPESFTNGVQLGATPPPVINTDPATCLSAGSSTITNYSTGNTYTFSPVGPTIGVGGVISGAIPGTAYNVTASNSGCTSTPATFTNTAQLSGIPNPAINTNPATCLAAGTSAVTNYGAGNTYTFSPSGPTVEIGGTITGATPGITYSITAASGGCTSGSASFMNGTQLPATATPAVNTISATCSAAGSSSITNYNASYVYTFSPSGPVVGAGGVISGAIPGTSYTVTASSGGCTSLSITFTNGVQLTAPAQPSAMSGNPLIPCGVTSESYAVTDILGVTYTWTYSGTGTINGSGHAITLDNISSGGTLIVTPSNACGTGVPQSVIITFSAIQLSINGVSPSCADTSTGSATVLAAGGTAPYHYQWSPSGGTAATATNLAPGIYTVTVTDQNTCSQNIQVTIAEADALNPNLNSTDIDCSSGILGSVSSSPSGGTAPYTYQWSNGGSTAVISNVMTGNYSVLITDANGCQATGSTVVDLINHSSITIHLTASSILAGDEVQLTSSTVPMVAGSSYSWTPSESLSCSDCPNPVAIPSETTTYQVTVVTPAGCSASATITITVSEGDVYVPNAFTPDGDEFNNEFKPVFPKDFNPYEYEMLIFNRWGEIIFESHDKEVGWDGTYLASGELCKEGIYTWKIQAKKSAHQTETLVRMGHVNLLK